jgi:hypothetical protein
MPQPKRRPSSDAESISTPAHDPAPGFPSGVSPALELQRLIVTRMNGQSEIVALPVQSDIARQIDEVVTILSRAAGPITLVSTVTGLIWLALRAL